MAFKFRAVLCNSWRLCVRKRFYNTEKEFDQNLLKVLVCPLSKEPLRYKFYNLMLSFQFSLQFYPLVDMTKKPMS